MQQVIWPLLKVRSFKGAVQSFLNDEWREQMAERCRQNRWSMPQQIEIVTAPPNDAPYEVRDKLCEIKAEWPGHFDWPGRIDFSRTELLDLGLVVSLSAVGDPFEEFPHGFVLKPFAAQSRYPVGTRFWCDDSPWYREGSTKKAMQRVLQQITCRRVNEYFVIQRFVPLPMINGNFHCMIVRARWLDDQIGYCVTDAICRETAKLRNLSEPHKESLVVVASM